jgi:hypothetical protein
MSKLAHSNCKTMAQIEREAQGRQTEPSTAGHLANCEIHEYRACSCGAGRARTETDARLARVLSTPLRTSKYAPHHAFMGRVEVAADSYLVATVSDKINDRDVYARLFALSQELFAFTDTVARLLLNGEEDGNEGQYEQQPDDAIDTIESLVVRARALRAKLTGAP